MNYSLVAEMLHAEMPPAEHWQDHRAWRDLVYTINLALRRYRADFDSESFLRICERGS